MNNYEEKKVIKERSCQIDMIHKSIDDYVKAYSPLSNADRNRLNSIMARLKLVLKSDPLVKNIFWGDTKDSGKVYLLLSDGTYTIVETANPPKRDGFKEYLNLRVLRNKYTKSQAINYIARKDREFISNN